MVFYACEVKLEKGWVIIQEAPGSDLCSVRLASGKVAADKLLKSYKRYYDHYSMDVRLVKVVLRAI